MPLPSYQVPQNTPKHDTPANQSVRKPVSLRAAAHNPQMHICSQASPSCSHLQRTKIMQRLLLQHQCSATADAAPRPSLSASASLRSPPSPPISRDAPGT
mmetsp:Transcript_26942/g.68585  ORF Transcript_26942/g.68585 Transcript_26942/m.68585 type:complete len:100 (+) Transcript_26942:1482-1781(+)